MWDWMIRARRVACMLPVLEQVLTGCGRPETRPEQAARRVVLPMATAASGPDTRPG
jgi:hypothetical protein